MSINVDHRVLGGFQCFDAITGSSIEEPLKIGSPQLTLARNPSGVYAVWDAVGFTKYTAFNPVLPWPTPPTNFEITIEDPRCCYLPRRGSIQVPQALPAAPAAAAPPFTATSDQSIVYAPQKITMYHGPAARVGANWAVVRASVSSNGSPPVPLRGAVLQVLSGSPPTAGAPPLATGVADTNGEALLAVPGMGLTVSQNPTGPVTEITTTATSAGLVRSHDSQPAAGMVARSRRHFAKTFRRNFKDCIRHNTVRSRSNGLCTTDSIYVEQGEEMPEYLTPGVYVEEVSFRAPSIEGVGTSTAGFHGCHSVSVLPPRQRILNSPSRSY